MVRFYLAFLLLVLASSLNHASAQSQDVTGTESFADDGADLFQTVEPEIPQAVGSSQDQNAPAPEPFYNLLSTPEEPKSGAFMRVRSSSDDIGLMIYGRIAIDSVTSNGRLLALYGYIFLGPDTPESQWTNVISARQSTLGFLFTGPDLGNFQTLARFETYFLSSVSDANVYGLAQYFMYAKVFNED